MSINISGIDVEFPFEPYDLQKDYMKCVIQCLQQGVNGALESPTGTGKTLCLLCSALAWLEVKKAQMQASNLCAINSDSPIIERLVGQFTNIIGHEWASNSAHAPFNTPKIIYTSRTHTQLTQVIQELKRTKYKYVKTSILGSREQMCIHPEVMKEENGSVKVHMCRNKIKTRTCTFYNRLKDDGITINKLQQEKNVIDIEDLISTGQKEKICPYFAARELSSTADVIFMPYNYIFDAKFRNSQNIDLQNSIIIFDEGHNIEKVCEETSSCDIRARDIANCIEEVDYVMRKVLGDRDNETESEYDEGSDKQNFTLQELALLKAMFCELEDNLQKITKTLLEGSYIFTLFDTIGLQVEKQVVVKKLIESVIEYMQSISQAGPFQKRGTGLQKFVEVLDVVFRATCSPVNLKAFASNYYKVFIDEEASKQKNLDSWTSKPLRILHFWCFNSGMSMKALENEKPHSIIVTSGTLHPIKKFVAELRIDFPITLQNHHIIKGDQIWAGIITKGPDEKILNSKFSNRNVDYMDSLGRTICNVIKMIPGGILVFFPSYTVMKLCCEQWQATGTWQTIGKSKLPLIESQHKSEFQSTMQLYYDAIKDPARKGAIFFGVCRGKVSEGLDFADMNGRAVIITGLPFANFTDSRVKLKREYLDEDLKKKVKNENSKMGLSGSEWYFLEAVRAVNQAIGRVIRHKNDYGAILLCDERFSGNDMKDKISGWVVQHMKRYDRFGEVIRGLRLFFKNAEKMFPQCTDNSDVKTNEEMGNISNNSDHSVASGNERSFDKKRVYNADFMDKRLPDGMELNEFKEAYKSEIDSSEKDVTQQPSTSRKSCFDLFNNLNPIPLSGQNTSKFQNNNSQASIDLPVKVENEYGGMARKKRKIVIKPLEENVDAVQTKEEKTQFFRIYLNKMKKNLTPETYASFTSVLREYRGNPCSPDKIINFVTENLKDKISLLYESRCIFIDEHKPLFDKTLTKKTTTS